MTLMMMNVERNVLCAHSALCLSAGQPPANQLSVPHSPHLEPHVIKLLLREEYIPRQERGSAQQREYDIHDAVCILDLLLHAAAALPAQVL